MFSGIIAACGRIEHVEQLADGIRITVHAEGLDCADLALGDSVANSGVCLTITQLDPAAQRLTFDVSRETLNCTVGLDQVGVEVNLEKALRLADRLGGHLVSGHVDGMGEGVQFHPLGESHHLRIRAPQNLARYIARKGSIAVNGVSLTTNTVEGCEFEINLIAHTLAHTNLRHLAPGARVNLEIDLIARYVERMMNADAGQ